MRWRRALLFVAAWTVLLPAQQPMTFQYFYDEIGQLIRVVDSTGIMIEYVYDAVGNMLEIKRSTVAVGGLSVLSFSPQSGGQGTRVVIQGLGFSADAAANTVRFNGLVTAVLTASGSQLAVAVPAGVSTGPITVTVNGVTARSTANFTAIPSPFITSLSHRAVVQGQTISAFRVTGAGLAGSTFAFVPTFAPPVQVTAGAVSGNSATMTVVVSPSALGVLTLVATNSFGSSDIFPASTNSVTVRPASNADEDLDGLTNAQEAASGTDPTNPDTDGDGYIDGVEVEAASDALDASVTPLSRDPLREAAGPKWSSLNTSSPSQAPGVIDPTIAIREAQSTASSILNVSDLSQAPGVTDATIAIREVLSTLSSVRNGTVSPSQIILPTLGPRDKTESVVSLRDASLKTVLEGTATGEITLLRSQTVVVGGSMGDTSQLFLNDRALGEGREHFFSVPFGTSDTMRLTVRATNSRTPPPSTLAVRAVDDPTAVVTGRAIDSGGNSVEGASALVFPDGFWAEFYPDENHPSTFASVDWGTPNFTRVFAAINMWNPEGALGSDPLGAGRPNRYKIRFRGVLRVERAGPYRFVVDHSGEASLRINGADVPSGSPVDLPFGWSHVELRYAPRAGWPSVRLRWAPPGAELSVVPPSAVISPEPAGRSITGQNGEFLVRGVPTVSGRVIVAVVKGVDTFGTAGPLVVAPMATNVETGVIRIMKGEQR